MEVFVSYQKNIIEDSILFTEIQDKFAYRVKKIVQKHFPDTDKCWAVWYQFPKNVPGPCVIIFDSPFDPINVKLIEEEIASLVLGVAKEIEIEYGR